MLKTIVAIVWVVGVAAPAQAGTLGPKKPSELVTLQASMADPICGMFGRRFSTRVTSDGTFELNFEIPPKRVLVVTGVEWSAFGLGANATNLVSLGTNGGASFFSGAALADASGTAGGQASFSHAIRPGTTICISSVGPSELQARLHGFLAKDR